MRGARTVLRGLGASNGPWLPDVRHEAVPVAVETATLSVPTAVLQDSTWCSAAGILPRHASLVTVGCEALGTSVSLIPQDGNETVRGRRDCQHQGGWGLGLRGMVNICEPLINVVIENKPKMLIDPARVDRLGPKGKGPGIGAVRSPIADIEPPAERRNLTHAGTVTERGKPEGLPGSEPNGLRPRSRSS